MKKLYNYVLGLLLVTVLSLGACSFSGPDRSAETRAITIMTWNIHNLFDGKDDGNEYVEFLQSSGWSMEKYKGRINSLSAAIRKIDPLPDVIIIQEAENLLVLEDLAFALPKGFNWSHFAITPEMAIGLGIISRIPIIDAKAHSIMIDGETTPRPVLEARIGSEEEEFIIFICHWKSKIGGDDNTENARKASARVILRRIREIWQSEPEMGIIVAGDLNENYDEFSRRGSNLICALLPDNPLSAKLTDTDEQKDFLVLTGNKPPSPVHFPHDTIVLYSPWVFELDNGSYYYRGSWETIDHFLISYQFFGDSGLRYKNSIVVDFEPFTGTNWIPVPYNPRTGSGLSDHLPLLINLFF